MGQHRACAVWVLALGDIRELAEPLSFSFQICKVSSVTPLGFLRVETRQWNDWHLVDAQGRKLLLWGVMIKLNYGALEVSKVRRSLVLLTQPLSLFRIIPGS